MSKQAHDIYVKRMMSTKKGREVFEAYKEKFGRYPARYFDLSDKEALEYIKSKLDTDK